MAQSWHRYNGKLAGCKSNRHSLLSHSHSLPCFCQCSADKSATERLPMSNIPTPISGGFEIGVIPSGEFLSDPQPGKRISAQQRLQEIVSAAGLTGRVTTHRRTSHQNIKQLDS